MEDLLLMKDAMDLAYNVIGRIQQDLAKHHKLYSKVEEASRTAWRIWPKIGRIPPDGWSPRVLTEWNEEYQQLRQELVIAHAAHQGSSSFTKCPSLVLA